MERKKVQQLRPRGDRLVQTAALFIAAMHLLTIFGSTGGTALRAIPPAAAADPASWAAKWIALLLFIGSVAVLVTLSPVVLWKWKIVNGVLEQAVNGRLETAEGLGSRKLVLGVQVGAELLPRGIAP